MASEKLLRKQAVRCADLARQTHDQESRERYLRLEQTYLRLAEAEEQATGRKGSGPSNSERKPAA